MAEELQTKATDQIKRVEWPIWVEYTPAVKRQAHRGLFGRPREVVHRIVVTLNALGVDPTTIDIQTNYPHSDRYPTGRR